MQQTILIVEDSPVNQELLSRILTRADYRVLAAGSGEAALEQVKLLLPDMIILDIMLPGMDGYSICRHLKSDERTKGIPVIFISSLDTT
ncbi:MAG: response regulator, partial [Thermodesulfobacteriota bacterium]|nr:response regulator [Thermodesulfobacteriota bacterium]